MSEHIQVTDLMNANTAIKCLYRIVTLNPMRELIQGKSHISVKPVTSNSEHHSTLNYMIRSIQGETFLNAICVPTHIRVKLVLNVTRRHIVAKNSVNALCARNDFGILAT